MSAEKNLNITLEQYINEIKISGRVGFIRQIANGGYHIKLTHSCFYKKPDGEMGQWNAVYRVYIPPNTLTSELPQCGDLIKVEGKLVKFRNKKTKKLYTVIKTDNLTILQKNPRNLEKVEYTDEINPEQIKSELGDIHF